MVTLTFETWEDFDNAIGGITSLVIATNEMENNE